MNKLFIGMAIQAFVTAVLVKSGLVNFSVGQQVIAGIFLLLCAFIFR